MASFKYRLVSAAQNAVGFEFSKHLVTYVDNRENVEGFLKNAERLLRQGKDQSALSVVKLAVGCLGKMLSALVRMHDLAADKQTLQSRIAVLKNTLAGTIEYIQGLFERDFPAPTIVAGVIGALEKYWKNDKLAQALLTRRTRKFA